LVYPPKLQPENARMNRLYDVLAPFYTWSENVLGSFFTGIDMRAERQKMLGLVPFSKGSSALEVSPGPGINLPALRRLVGPEGRLTALDLSLPMLRQCRKTRLADDLVLGNGSYLPFATDTFDGLFHFGGVNLFDEPERALAEFVRVVRPGGIVAWGDEGFAPHLPDSWRKRFLARVNPGFAKMPPPAPSGIGAATTHRVMGGFAYLLVAQKLLCVGHAQRPCPAKQPA
jgi:ubiquinone/menaquinone biosynthesis C-methylase UbiE